MKFDLIVNTLLVYAGKKAILGTWKSYTFHPRNTLILEQIYKDYVALPLYLPLTPAQYPILLPIT